MNHLIQGEIILFIEIIIYHLSDSVKAFIYQQLFHSRHKI